MRTVVSKYAGKTSKKDGWKILLTWLLVVESTATMLQFTAARGGSGIINLSKNFTYIELVFHIPKVIPNLSKTRLQRDQTALGEK